MFAGYDEYKVRTIQFRVKPDFRISELINDCQERETVDRWNVVYLESKWKVGVGVIFLASICCILNLCTLKCIIVIACVYILAYMYVCVFVDWL